MGGALRGVMNHAFILKYAGGKAGGSSPHPGC